MKICSKTHQIATLKKTAWLPHTSQAASRHATHQAPQKVAPPMANPAYAHGLLLRNLFEEMRS